MLAHQQLAAAAKQLKLTAEVREHSALSLALADELLVASDDQDIVTDAAQCRIVWGTLEEDLGDEDKAREIYRAAATSLEELAAKNKLGSRGRRTLTFLKSKLH